VSKRTYQPHNKSRKRTHGFRARKKTRGGREVLRRRRAKGRKRLSVTTAEKGVGAGLAPQGISKGMRLRQRAEFVVVQSEGQKVHGRHVLAIARKRSSPDLIGRVGLTVTKKIGNSVARNRIRRMLREWLRLHGWVPVGWDVVLVAKDSSARQLHPDDFEADLTRIQRHFS